MMKIGICDDDKFIFPKIERVIRDYATIEGLDYQFFTFDSEKKLFHYLQNNSLELLFLDIDMPDKNGIVLSKEIHACSPDCEIAFCTNYLEYAVEVYETVHCYFILKDQFAERLPYVIKKVLDKKSNKANKIFIKSGGINEVIYTNTIIYIERKGRKSYYFLEDGMIKVDYTKLEDLLATLDKRIFVRCHNSYIISFEKVKKYTRQKMIMINGEEIPISRPYIKLVGNAFTEYSWIKI
ncbi:DNA-binding response regulator [Lachnospiraceae bacterium TF09-5]|nr:DNA-binding response regulator [Lachnospiraceae bacterium TF09-5]